MSISLVTVETMYHDLAARSLTETLEHFNADEVVTFSNKPILSGAKHIQVDHFNSVHSYCEFLLRGMLEHIKTDHILFVQWDAMAYNRAQWTDEFLKYDYIGAPWHHREPQRCIGNGGFSLRSYKLLEALQDTTMQMDPNHPMGKNEDEVIGITFRSYLEDKYHIKYPSKQLASQFSYELGPLTHSFGFHGPWNIMFFSKLETVEYFLVHMDYKPWNPDKWCHLLSALASRKLPEHFSYAVNRLVEATPQHFDIVRASLAHIGLVIESVEPK